VAQDFQGPDALCVTQPCEKTMREQNMSWRKVYVTFLWLPYGIGQTIIFCPVVSSSFLSLPNLSSHRLDVCHTSTHGVALVRI